MRATGSRSAPESLLPSSSWTPTPKRRYSTSPAWPRTRAARGRTRRCSVTWPGGSPTASTPTRSIGCCSSDEYRFFEGRCRELALDLERAEQDEDESSHGEQAVQRNDRNREVLFSGLSGR